MELQDGRLRRRGRHGMIQPPPRDPPRAGRTPQPLGASNTRSGAARSSIHSGGISFRTLRYQRSAAWDDVSSLTFNAPRPPNLLAIVVILLFCWFLIIPYVLNQLYPRLRCSLTLNNGDRIR